MVTSVNIKVIDSTPTYSNPTIPATGGIGGARTSQGSSAGNASDFLNYSNGGGTGGAKWYHHS